MVLTFNLEDKFCRQNEESRPSAGRENRTPILSLATIHFTTKLYPQYKFKIQNWRQKVLYIIFLDSQSFPFCILNFAFLIFYQCARRDSNPQPLGPKPSALSIEPRAHNGYKDILQEICKNRKV